MVRRKPIQGLSVLRPTCTYPARSINMEGEKGRVGGGAKKSVSYLCTTRKANLYDSTTPSVSCYTERACGDTTSIPNRSTKAIQRHLRCDLPF